MVRAETLNSVDICIGARQRELGRLPLRGALQTQPQPTATRDESQLHQRNLPSSLPLIYLAII